MASSHRSCSDSSSRYGEADHSIGMLVAGRRNHAQRLGRRPEEERMRVGLVGVGRMGTAIGERLDR
jgi:hypothetical protein